MKSAKVSSFLFHEQREHSGCEIKKGKRTPHASSCATTKNALFAAASAPAAADTAVH